MPRKKAVESAAAGLEDEKSSRIDFRVRREHKLLMEKAANYAGQTLTGFAITTLVQRAQDVVTEYESVRLTNRDRDRFLLLLDQPGEPTEALERAARRHRELIVDAED